MNTKQKKGLIIASAALLGVLGFATLAKAGPKGCGPFKIKKQDLADALDAAIDAGSRSASSVAVFVAVQLFPVHPKTGKPLTWPPAEGVKGQQVCAWKAIMKAVVRYFKAKGYPPFPPCPDGSELNPVTGMCEAIQPPQPGGVVPPESGEDGGYPNPGTFVQVQYGDRGLGKFTPKKQSEDAQGTALRSLAYTTLLSAGWMAAKDNGATDDQAGAFATLVGGKHRKKYWDEFIECSPYNDMVYLTHGYNPSYSSENPSGRAERLMPYHADNRANIFSGQPSQRRLAVGKFGDEAQKSTRHSAPGGTFAYLWLPMPNLDVLWESGGTVLTAEGADWADGSSMMNPPPEVMELGFDNVPSGTWGCGGASTTL